VTYIEELKKVIERLHGVEAKYVQSVPIKEVFQGKTIWDGVVEVFDLIGHPKAKRVYAWAHATDGEKKRHVTVLHLGPVDTPKAAVMAAIVQEFRNVEEA
jgi:hypothetical protein